MQLSVIDKGGDTYKINTSNYFLYAWSKIRSNLWHPYHKSMGEIPNRPCLPVSLKFCQTRPVCQIHSIHSNMRLRYPWLKIRRFFTSDLSNSCITSQLLIGMRFRFQTICNVVVSLIHVDWYATMTRPVQVRSCPDLSRSNSTSFDVSFQEKDAGVRDILLYLWSRKLLLENDFGLYRSCWPCWPLEAKQLAEVKADGALWTD